MKVAIKLAIVVLLAMLAYVFVDMRNQELPPSITAVYFTLVCGLVIFVGIHLGKLTDYLLEVRPSPLIIGLDDRSFRHMWE